MRSRWARLLEDPGFRRWYENLARGSEVTAKENARVLYRFLRRCGLTPGGLVEMARRDREGVENLLSDFISGLHREGYAPGYLEGYLKAVRSWLSYNGVELVRRIKIGNRGVTPTLEEERVPTPEELRQILNYAGDRGRCSISLMAFSGLRPQVLGDLTGRKGLELRDLPELRVEGGAVIFTRVPTMVVVRPELSKAGHRYFTFLTSEGCDYLKAYLERRLAMGEDLGPRSPVIAVNPGYEETGWRRGERPSAHVTTKTITKEIRDAMRPRFRWRPYVLRAYFDTQLMMAESRGKISHAYRQFFMGHKGDMEARYTVNKGRLPEDVIEDMRRCYAACEEYLTTRPRGREDPELTTIRTMVESGVLDLTKPQVRSYLIQKLGIGDVEVRVARLRETGLGEEEAYTRLICEELGVEPLRLEAFKLKNPDPKIIDEEKLERYLAEGWEIQTVLPSGRILIRKK
ncbi:MAG: site-specific integrase [Candidatus Bathyarchaeia archaeon]